MYCLELITLPCRRIAAGLLMSCCILTGVFSAGIANAQTDPGYTTEDIMKHINETYAKTISAKGKISRVTDFGEGEPDRFDGTFVIQKPFFLHIALDGASPRTSVFDGTYYRLFFPSENRGYYTEASNLTAGQRFVLGAGPYFGNIFDGMADTFTFKAVDLFEGNIIVKATPIGQSPYRYVLIGISPDTWTIRIVEYFDDAGEVVRQIRYLTFKSAEGGVYFPTTVETSMILASHVMTETLYLTDVVLNGRISDSEFAVPGDKDTHWASEPFEMNRNPR